MGVLEAQIEVTATASSTRIEVRVRGNSQGSGVAAIDLLRRLNVSALATSLNVGITTSMPAEEQLINHTVLTMGLGVCPKGAYSEPLPLAPAPNPSPSLASTPTLAQTPGPHP